MLAICKNLAYFAQHFQKASTTYILCLALNLNLMKKRSLALNIFIVIAYGCILLLGSCTPAKNVVYFQNIQKDTNIPGLIDSNFESKIRKNDLLSINIVSREAISNALYNAPQGSTTSSTPSSGTVSPASGYLVDNDGNIKIFKIGNVHAEGLTRNELAQTIKRELDPAYLLDVVVTVRYLNNHITILGEVTRPQVITMPTEKLSLLEAIGMTGDITITGRKDNILLIRETAKGKQFKRLNLTDNSIVNSPFYYLKPDDIIYVEPTSIKIKNSGNTPQIIGYVLASLSILISIIFNLRR